MTVSIRLSGFRYQQSAIGFQLLNQRGGTPPALGGGAFARLSGRGSLSSQPESQLGEIQRRRSKRDPNSADFWGGDVYMDGAVAKGGGGDQIVGAFRNLIELEM